jgi:hypothetical protein
MNLTKSIVGLVCGSMVTVVGGKAVLLAEKACPVHGKLCQPIREDLDRYQAGGTLINSLTTTTG